MINVQNVINPLSENLNSELMSHA